MEVTTSKLSKVEIFAQLSAEERKEFIESLSPAEVVDFEHDWTIWARPNQLPPGPECPCCGGNWINWLLLAGRGFGKTRTGAEWVHESTKVYGRFHLVGATAADVRDVMIEGESGLLATAKRGNAVRYSPTKRRLDWENGALALCYSGEEPERLRGPQCFVAGTLIDTPTGRVPIESIRVGDVVTTRLGPRPVIATMTTNDAEVGRVGFSDGSSLIGTADHPLLISSAQWIPLSALTLGTLVCTGGSAVGAMSSPMDTDACSTPIELSGSLPTGQSLRVGTSTTRIKTEPIMPWRTWSYSHLMTTRIGMSRFGPSLASNVRTVGRLSRERTFAPLWSASNAPRGGPRPSGRKNDSAVIVESSSLPAGVSSVVSVVSTWEAAGSATVYNLTVGDLPEYIASGVVVHNCEAAWADELAAWEYEETWSQLQLGLRLGVKPRTVITTTPKPTRLIKRLVKDMDREWPKRLTHVTTGSTFENTSNLSETFINEITSAWDGTRFGRQEIYAEILDDAEAALWNRQLLEDTRIQQGDLPRLQRVVIGVDPAVSFGQENAETGIVVCGLGMNGHAYVLHDASGRYKPDGWARKVALLHDKFGADRIVAEKNMGGDLVEYTIKVEDPNLPVKLVYASKNKIPRAEPISTAWEKGTAHMVGFWSALESQMCTYEAGSQESPDRMDAMVWAMTELIGRSYTITVPAMIENELGAKTSYWRGIDQGR